jgi:hypothetical protein
VVLGASCTGTHQIVLDRPSVTPTTGSSETSFTFAVRYRDTANCPPRKLAVQIPGIGTFDMKQGAGKTWRQGVNFARVLNLPPGTWEYTFVAVSGTGAGEQTVGLTAANPLVVSGPVTPPPGNPTASPPPGSSKPPGSATPAPGGSPAPGGFGSGDGRKPPSGDEPSGFAFQIPAIFGGPMGAVVGPWMVLTGIGVAIFWVFLRRPPESRRGSGAMARAGGMRLAGAPGAGEEGALPRWLRPSLQAARQAGWGVPPPREPVRFRASAARGVDRREIGYRLVRVADGPDDFGSEEIGRFDRGDQVEILETKGPFVRVRGADGLEGWVQQAAIVSILD